MADGRFEEIVITRDSSAVPWGFRLSENTRHPTVVRLNSRSVATGHLKTGDLILKIGSQFTEAKPYSDILQLIKDSGNELVLLVDRGNTAKAMWAAQDNEKEKAIPQPPQPPPKPQPHVPQWSQPPPQSQAPQWSQPLQQSQTFHSVHHMGTPDKRPFTYTPNPRDLEKELQERHNAMRRDRQQNLARTAASVRQNMSNTAALEAAMPRFSLTDDKDYTQSEVYRLLDEEEVTRKPVNRQPIRSAMSRSNANDQNAKKTVKVLRFLSDEGSADQAPREQRSVRITEETTSYPYVQEDEDGQCKVGEYHQKSIRYLGRNIPSKSFRMLQSLMGNDGMEEDYAEPRRQNSFEPKTDEDLACTDF